MHTRHRYVNRSPERQKFIHWNATSLAYDELFEMYRTARKFYLKRKLLPFLDREKDV